MREWHIYKLGDLIDIKHGFAFKSECFSDDPTDDILLTPGNFVIGGGFKYDKLKYYKGEAPHEFILQPGNLLVTMTDLSKQSDTLGYPAFVPDTRDKRYLHNQRLGLVQIRPDAPVTKRFLYYLMCSREYRHEIIASATGTTVKHTAPSRIAAFEFRLPPLTEQRAIAHILGALDDKIELNRRMNETLEAMARAIFKSWFVDFDPVRARAEGRDTGLPGEIADLFPDSFEDSELGDVPRGWEVKPLDKIADFLNGLACQKYPPKNGEESLPVIKIRELRQGITDNTDRATVDVPSKYIVEDGDILFSWSGSLLVDIWCQGRGVLNQHVFKVTSEDFPRWFYFYWTTYHLNEFQRIAADKATTMGHIKRHHLSDAKVLVPPAPLLDSMTESIDSLVKQRINNELQKQTLATLRDTFLPKLLSGELRVPDAEKFIEEGGV